MTAKNAVEIVSVGVMAVAMCAILWTRRERGIGWRVIQFTAVSLALPTILILSLEGSISSEVTGTLLGAIVGYFFSRDGKDDLSGNKKEKDDSQVRFSK